MKSKVCSICGNSFELPGHRKYCSIECSERANYLQSRSYIFKKREGNITSKKPPKELVLTNGLEIIYGCFALEVYGHTIYWDRKIKLSN